LVARKILIFFLLVSIFSWANGKHGEYDVKILSLGCHLSHTILKF
jgi:hypothetical protein